MIYVKTDRVIEVIRRVYPGAANIRIMQGFKSRGGWRKLDGDNGYPIREMPRLFEAGYELVQLRLLSDGTVKYPDYRIDEFAQEFKWEPRDQLVVDVNQGKREAYVLAVIGDEALIEYEMPGGTTALWVIHAGRPHPRRIRNVSYKSCTKKWLKAIEEAGTIWEGQGQ